jgi:hypothetical protein
MAKSLDEIFNENEIEDIKKAEINAEKEINEISNDSKEEKGEFKIDKDIANLILGEEAKAILNDKD